MLKLFNIAHYVCGGFAVQEHGYPRFTVDVDQGPLTLPMPTHVSDNPQVLTLQKLISSKLSTYIGRGIERLQDSADVVKLIQANRLARDYEVDPGIRGEYHKIWDGLYQTKKDD